MTYHRRIAPVQGLQSALRAMTAKGTRRVRGFSLIELMLVVAIIGIFAGILAPNMIAELRDLSTRNRAAALVRMAAKWRQEVRRTGLVHVLAYITDPTDNTRDAVALFKGNQRRCNLVAWDYTGPSIRIVRARDDGYTPVLRIMPDPMLAPLNARLCLEPSGTVLYAQGAAPFTPLLGGVQDIPFVLRRELAGVPIGMSRTVVFVGASARSVN